MDAGIRRVDRYCHFRRTVNSSQKLLNIQTSRRDAHPEMAIMPNVSFEPSPLGITSSQVGNVDGNVFRRVTEVAMPNLGLRRPGSHRALRARCLLS